MSDAIFPAQRGTTPLDIAIAAIAEPQGGFVNRPQLLALGLSKHDIQGRIDRGTLIPVHRGVYAVGHIPADPRARLKGALLSCGEQSVAFARSAGAYWDLWGGWPPRPVIAVPDRRRSTTVEIHRVTRLSQDVWTPDAHLRVTSPARTLLDLSHFIPGDGQLTWLISNLLVRKLATVDQFVSVIARNPRHPDTSRLAHLLGATPDEPFRSPWEVDWPPFAAAHGFTGWEMNAKLGAIRVDVLFGPDRLVVWLDGWQTHQTRAQFELDRAEANDLLAQRGIPAIRITHRQFHDTPDRAAGWVSGALRRVGAD